MFDVAESLKPALREAQHRLDDASQAIAHADGGSSDRVLAQSAQAALFESALLSAARARIEEVKTAVKQ